VDEAASRYGSLALHHEGTKAAKDSIAPSNITVFVPFVSFVLVAKGALTNLIRRGICKPYGVEMLRT
jgi:hypothetical protein